MDKLKELYYSPAGYQRGTRAASRLHKKVPELSKKDIQHWLDRQPIYQIYKAAPKRINFPHYSQDKPNHTHQVDILYLPHDKKYKYALTVIDIASRYKEAEPLKTKQASDTAEAIQKIYSRSPLTYPENIMADNGKEFMGSFIKLMKDHNVKISRSLQKKKVAFVERFNRTLSEKLFAHQYAEEMKSDNRSREWVDRLPDVIKAMNDEETRMIGKKPADAIKLETVEQPEHKDIPEELSLDSLVRYLYKPGEAEDDNRYRATDPIWSVDVYDIDEIRSFLDQPALYTLQGLDPERTFTREQLQVIPEDTDFMRDHIINDGETLSKNTISSSG
jgi:hypothetical protein